MFIGIKGALEYNVLSGKYINIVIIFIPYSLSSLYILEEIKTLAPPLTLREYHGCALFKVKMQLLFKEHWIWKTIFISKAGDGKVNVVISGGKEAGGKNSL